MEQYGHSPEMILLSKMYVRSYKYPCTTADIWKLKATGAKVLEVDYVNENTIAKAAKEYGTAVLDCLINCAGNGVRAPLLRQTLIFVSTGVSPQPFPWDADSGDRLLEMYRIMAVVS